MIAVWRGALDSPRKRRRLLLAGLGLVPLVVILIVVLLIPERGGISGGVTGNEGPAQLASNKHYRLSARDRRTIDSVLDRWIPAAVERGDAATAWALSGPEMRASTTLAQWKRGDLPAPVYPSRERTFHHWTVIDVGADYVIFNLILHPAKGNKEPTTEFSGQMVRHGSGWLVNRFYTIATFGTHEIGPADFAAPPGNASVETRSHRSHAFLVPIIAIVALVLLVPLILGLAVLVRGHRWRRARAADPRNSLPPLPSSVFPPRPRGGEEDEAEPVATRNARD